MFPTYLHNFHILASGIIPRPLLPVQWPKQCRHPTSFNIFEEVEAEGSQDGDSLNKPRHARILHAAVPCISAFPPPLRQIRPQRQLQIALV